MGRLQARPFTVHLDVGIRAVELDHLDIAAFGDPERALSGGLQPGQHLVLDLEVPGQVVFAGLKHRASSRGSVPAALHLDRIEIGPVGLVVVRVDHAGDQVARTELLEQVGACADRLEVIRSFAGLRARVRLEQVLGDDHPVLAYEGIGPEGHRRLGRDPDGVVVDLFGSHGVVAADGDGGGRRVADVGPVEYDVVGGERLAVVPLHALLELPGDRLAVLGEAAIGDARQLGSQDRTEFGLRVPCRKGLVK